jgi:hypothetical protein
MTRFFKFPCDLLFLNMVVIIIARLAAAFVAAGFAFFLAAAPFVALAAIPNRSGDYVDAAHGLMRVVTFDHQFACARALHRVILNDYIEAGAGMQVFRERIVDQAEMLVVQPQRDAVHVQLAATNIADDDSRWLRFTPPKTAEPVTASLPGGARPVTAIVAGLDGSSLVTVIIALAGPSAAGAKRIGTLIALSASIVAGNCGPRAPASLRLRISSAWLELFERRRQVACRLSKRRFLTPAGNDSPNGDSHKYKNSQRCCASR